MSVHRQPAANGSPTARDRQGSGDFKDCETHNEGDDDDDQVVKKGIPPPAAAAADLNSDSDAPYDAAKAEYTKDKLHDHHKQQQKMRHSNRGLDRKSTLCKIHEEKSHKKQSKMNPFAALKFNKTVSSPKSAASQVHAKSDGEIGNNHRNRSKGRNFSTDESSKGSSSTKTNMLSAGSKPFQKILKRWKNERRPGLPVDAAVHRRRKELSEVLEIEVKLGKISESEMMEILAKEDRVVTDKVFSNKVEGEAEFVYACEKIGYYVRKHFCAGGNGRNKGDEIGSSDRDTSDLATIKIMRGAGADEIMAPKISTKMGIVSYSGHQARIHDDGTVEEMDEQETVIMQQYRSGVFDLAVLQQIMNKHQEFLALCLGADLERRRHDTVINWMAKLDRIVDLSPDVSHSEDGVGNIRVDGSPTPSERLKTMHSGSPGSGSGTDGASVPGSIPNVLNLFQRIKSKTQSLATLRKNHNYSRWRKRSQNIPAVIIAIHGGAFDKLDAFRDSEPKVQERMIAFLKDLGKKKLGIAVFFMLPNATEDEKSDAERLLHRNGFKGLYSGTILTWPGEDSDGRPTGGPGYDSPNKNHDVNIGDTCSPDAIRRFVESRGFHVVANMAMEPSWLNGGATDMHVFLQEEGQDGRHAGRSRARSYSQSSDDSLGLPDLSTDSDDNDLGLPPLSELLGCDSSSDDQDIPVPGLFEFDNETPSEDSGGRRRRGRC